MSERKPNQSQSPDLQNPDAKTPGAQARLKPEDEPHSTTPPASSGDSAAPEETGLISLATHWAATAGSRVKVMLELVVAEARLAAISVALMAFLAMLAAAFVLGAWAILIAGLIYGLIQMGLPLWPILFVLFAVHVLIALLAWRGAVKLSNNLEFPITRQQFQQAEEEADEVDQSTTQS